MQIQHGGPVADRGCLGYNGLVGAAWGRPAQEQGTTTVNMDIVEKLVGIVLADSGMASVADEGHLVAYTAWDSLNQTDKEYILKLTDQDLENILCGLSDEDENFNTLWEVSGEWITIPRNVERFLDSVYNAVVGLY